MRISLFTVIVTFGTARDVTADELRIESLFPADAATEAVFRPRPRSRFAVKSTASNDAAGAQS